MWKCILHTSKQHGLLRPASALLFRGGGYTYHGESLQTLTARTEYTQLEWCMCMKESPRTTEIGPLCWRRSSRELIWNLEAEGTCHGHDKEALIYVLQLIQDDENSTWVVFNKDSSETPDVTLASPSLFTTTSTVCFSDPSLKPVQNKVSIRWTLHVWEYLPSSKQYTGKERQGDFFTIPYLVKG